MGKKLTAEVISQGIKYREEVELPAYDEMTVEIRPIADVEFKNALRATGIKDENVDISGGYEIMYEVAKIGITDKEIVKHLDQLIGDSVTIIGEAIMRISHLATKEIEDFTEAAKEDT